MEATRTAAAIQAFMPQIQIPGEGNAYWFLDGGARDLLPLGQAIREGADDITAIVLGPELPADPKRLRTIFDVLMRTMNVVMEEVSENDVSYGALITRELLWRQRLRQLLCQTCDAEKVSDSFNAASQADEPMAKDGRPFAAVSFRLLRPRKEIGGTLDFKPELMRRFEQEGYDYARDAANWQRIP